MKKRLLITSIVMMLVVAVALSTATYAWFTSSNAVQASSVTLTANTSDSTSLGIGWAGGAAGSELTVALTNEGIDPMAPVDLTTSSTVYTVDFKTATIKSDAGNLVFNNDVATANPVIFNNGLSGASKKDTFYVKNLSQANAIDHVTLTATIAANDGNAGNGSSLIRAAVFKRATAGTGDYVLVGVLASAADASTVWGPVATKLKAGEQISNLNSYATVTSIDLGSLAAEAQFDLAIVVWMDGTALDDTKAGYGAHISFTFTATRNQA